MRKHGFAKWTLAVGLLAGIAAWASDPKLPSPLSGYRSWKALTAAPQPIPYQLAQLCAPAKPASGSDDDHGPHTNRWVMAYANRAAASALANASVTRFPVGATLAKEKRTAPDARHPEGVAFMVKHKAGAFRASDGWEFLFYPTAGKTADYSGCIGCHRSRGKKDYVFGTYGPDASR